MIRKALLSHPGTHAEAIRYAKDDLKLIQLASHLPVDPGGESASFLDNAFHRITDLLDQRALYLGHQCPLGYLLL